MCLMCTDIGVQSKEDILSLFKWSRQKTFIHTFDNKVIQLNNIQIDEIIENALCVIATSVDLSCDIWAIQWPREYIVKSL